LLIKNEVFVFFLKLFFIFYGTSCLVQDQFSSFDIFLTKLEPSLTLDRIQLRLHYTQLNIYLFIYLV
jgi:hypothetical protein